MHRLPRRQSRCRRPHLVQNWAIRGQTGGNIRKFVSPRNGRHNWRASVRRSREAATDRTRRSAGKAIDAPWDVLDRAYFNGYALWSYLTTPFHFVMPGFSVEEIDPWRESDELWLGLRVTYPPDIASHSRNQDFYFGSDFLFRRHDHHVEASGGFAAAHYVFDPVTVQGITFPTKRRAYMRDDRLMPIHDRLMVSIDRSDIVFS